MYGRPTPNTSAPGWGRYHPDTDTISWYHGAVDGRQDPHSHGGLRAEKSAPYPMVKYTKSTQGGPTQRVGLFYIITVQAELTWRSGVSELRRRSRHHALAHFASHRCGPSSIPGLDRGRLCEKFRQLIAVGRWSPPGIIPVSSTRKLISSSSFHRLDMTLAFAEALNPNTPIHQLTWRNNGLTWGGGV